MTPYVIRTINGERVLAVGESETFMGAQRDAQRWAQTLGTSVYLWFADRAPVRVDPA